MDSPDEVFVGEDDFKFFLTLPNDEKILCLFDIWVMQDDSIDLQKIIDLSIKDSNMANVVMTNNLLIVNADDYKLVKTAAKHFFETGFVLKRLLLTDSGNKVFRRQNYCNVYDIVGTTYPLSLN